MAHVRFVQSICHDAEVTPPVGRDVPLQRDQQNTILILKQPGAAAPEPVFPTKEPKVDVKAPPRRALTGLSLTGNTLKPAYLELR